MRRDGHTIINATEPREVVIDEATDLLELYKLENPTREDIKTALEQHYQRFGRIGFNSEVDEDSIDNFYSHFTRNSREYLEAEARFIQEVLSGNLAGVVEQGYFRARTLLPEQEYQTPQAVLLLNGKRTDAKVLGDGQFGINLQNLFSTTYSRENKTYNMQRALRIIRNNSAHEATHILIKQIEHSEDEKVNSLVGGAFNEGLATFAQFDLDYPWSEDYLRDSEQTLDIIRATFRGGSNESILSSLCDMESLKKHKPEEIQMTQELLSRGSISDDEFRTTLLELLVDKNGPLYYAGYAIWKKIYETEGLDRLHEIVKQGPAAFLPYMVGAAHTNGSITGLGTQPR